MEGKRERGASLHTGIPLTTVGERVAATDTPSLRRRGIWVSMKASLRRIIFRENDYFVVGMTGPPLHQVIKRLHPQPGCGDSIPALLSNLVSESVRHTDFGDCYKAPLCCESQDRHGHRREEETDN